MFGNHPDSMPPESTPERVFALVKLVAKNPNSREQLRAALVMQDVFGSQHEDVFKKTIKCADELGLISDKDGIVRATPLVSKFNDYYGFRKYVSNLVFSNSNSTFFRVSEWYLAQNEKVHSLINWEGAAAQADREGISVRENDMLGWRWWASFLGLGYLHGTTLISNLAVRLKDCLTTIKESDKKDEFMTATLFVKNLEVICPETTKSRRDRVLGLGVSNGLRVLKKHGHIDLLSQRDAERIKLFPIAGSTENDFSHVQLIKE